MLKKMLLNLTIFILIASNLFLWPYVYDIYIQQNRASILNKENTSLKSKSIVPKDVELETSNDSTSNTSKSVPTEEINAINEEKGDSNQSAEQSSPPVDQPQDNAQSTEETREDDNNTKALKDNSIDTFNGNEVHNLKQGQHKLILYATYSGDTFYWDKGELYSHGEKISLETDTQLIAYNSKAGDGEQYRNNYSGSIVGNELHTHTEEGVDVYFILDSVNEDGYQKLKMTLYVKVGTEANANMLYNIKLNLKVTNIDSGSSFTIGNENTPNKDLYINVLENDAIDFN